MDKKTVIIADDHPIFRSGLKALIEAEPSFSVVAEASDGEEVLKVMAKHEPDLLILDYNMPAANGFEVLAKLSKMNTSSIPIMLTMHSDEAMFAKAFELGVKGYVLKDSALVDIVNCLHAVSQGQIFTSPAVTTYLFKRVSRAGSQTAGLASLTTAERKILRMIADYKTSREIAEHLCVSVRTVENHRANMSSKLGVNGSHGLFKFALQHESEIS
jgi:DNA-binding NarL/FixJ family response regulator